MEMALVLASGSRIRADLLKNAGLDIEIDPADVDERVVEAPLLEAGFPPEDLASVLAEAKANDVSDRRAGDLVRLPGNRALAGRRVSQHETCARCDV